MIITLWVFVAISAAAIKVVRKRHLYGITVETVLIPSSLILEAMVLAAWPLLIALFLLGKTLGPFLPEPDNLAMARADSLRAVPDENRSGVPNGANISLGPDQL